MATLLYPVTDRPFRELYELAASWSAARRNEVIDVALESRTRRDELLREFPDAPYVFDIVMDIGAYRDLHRHRRCQQFRQAVLGQAGIRDAGGDCEARASSELYAVIDLASAVTLLRSSRRLARTICCPSPRARVPVQDGFRRGGIYLAAPSGVKGHFSYRKIAWEMKEKMEELEPELAA